MRTNNNLAKYIKVNTMRKRGREKEREREREEERKKKKKDRKKENQDTRMKHYAKHKDRKPTAPVDNQPRQHYGSSGAPESSQHMNHMTKTDGSRSLCLPPSVTHTHTETIENDCRTRNDTRETGEDKNDRSTIFKSNHKRKNKQKATQEQTDWWKAKGTTHPA